MTKIKAETAKIIPPAATTAPAFFTVAGFGASFGVGRSFIYNLIAAKKLRAVKAGKLTLIPRDAAEKWAATLPAWKPGAGIMQGRPGRAKAA